YVLAGRTKSGSFAYVGSESCCLTDILGQSCFQDHSPPFQGGVAAPLIKRSRSFKARPGWLVTSTNKVRFAVRLKPPRSLRNKVPSRHFLKVANTPPLKGGECSRTPVLSNSLFSPRSVAMKDERGLKPATTYLNATLMPLPGKPGNVP